MFEQCEGTDTGGSGGFVEEGYYIERFVLSQKQPSAWGLKRAELLVAGLQSGTY